MTQEPKFDVNEEVHVLQLRDGVWTDTEIRILEIRRTAKYISYRGPILIPDRMTVRMVTAPFQGDRIWVAECEAFASSEEASQEAYRRNGGK